MESVLILFLFTSCVYVQQCDSQLLQGNHLMLTSYRCFYVTHGKNALSVSCDIFYIIIGNTLNLFLCREHLPDFCVVVIILPFIYHCFYVTYGKNSLSVSCDISLQSNCLDTNILLLCRKHYLDFSVIGMCVLLCRLM